MSRNNNNTTKDTTITTFLLLPITIFSIIVLTSTYYYYQNNNDIFISISQSTSSTSSATTTAATATTATTTNILTNNYIANKDHPTNNNQNIIKVEKNDYYQTTITDIENNWGVDKEYSTYRYTAGSITTTTTTQYRRTHQGFLKCLANKNIVLIGDSRVRFQYMSLAAFLTHKEWPRCKEGKIIPKNKPSCYLIHSSDNLWTNFFSNSTQYLSQNGGNELCYCYRLGKHDPIRENRFFTLNTTWGLIQITYLQSFMDFIYFGKLFPPFIISTDNITTSVKNERCTPGTCIPKREITTTVENSFPILFQFNLTHLFVNTGWIEKDIGCLLTEFEHKTGVLSYEISHLSWLGKRTGGIIPPFISGDYIPQSCQAKVFDRYTPTLYMRPEQYSHDRIHVLGSGNEELNHLLMNNLCGDIKI
jgi:hypothetical protein